MENSKMQENKKISITGGTGHLGTGLIEMLIKKNFSVNALYYHKEPTYKHPNLIWIKGDITKPGSCNALFNNSSALIHSASIISLGGIDKGIVYDINVRGTENIIASCLDNKVKMIYISSSAAVVETSPHEVYNEKRPYKTKNDFTYDWTKATAEKRVLNSIKDKDLDAFIIRPTAIIGPPDKSPSHFGQTILDMADYKLPFITSGGYNIVDLRDLSQTIINSLDLGKKGEIYLVGGSYYSIRQIAKIANPTNYFISIPLSFLLFILPIIKLYEKCFSLPWPISKESLTTLKRAPKQMDCSKAKNELKHSVRPVKETIQDLITWFRKVS